jgi:hypothetical protein
MAREKHIVDLTIGNFKRFADFKVENLGQFNLIVGDNNTGKTSLLEALLFDEERDVYRVIESLFYSLFLRNKEKQHMELGFYRYVFQHFSMFLNQRNKLDNELKMSFKTLTKTTFFSLRLFDLKNDFELLGTIEKMRLAQSPNFGDFVFKKDDDVTTTLTPSGRSDGLITLYHPFVPFGLGYDDTLLKLYSDYIDISTNARKGFIKNLRIFIPKVNDVRSGNGVINIYEKNVDTPMPLYAYGEGANKLFRILCEIAMNKGKRLMIDEIDAGIHYSRFKDFWRTIMKVAKSYDVQIFATTHNLECINYFHEVLEEQEMKDYQELGRVVALKEIEDNEVKARVYNYEYLEYAEEANRELRE